MKLLYILGALMFIGVFLMFVSSYKVFSVLQTAGGQPLDKNVVHASAPGLQLFLMAGYLGITFFAVGALGALIVIIQMMTRRF